MINPLRFAALVLLGAVACKGDAPPPPPAEQQPATQASGSASGSSPYVHEHKTPPIATTASEPVSPRRPGPVAPAQPARPAPGALTLAVGTSIEATMQDTLSSEHGRAGQTVTAIVSRDVMDGGTVVIPAGAPLTLTIAQIQTAANSSDSDGTLVLAVTSVSVRGSSYPLSAELESVPHLLVGRGVTLGSAGKVAAGAVLGTIAGRVIGRNTRGAVIGGAVGAGAGVIIAAHTQDRDVVIPAGTTIVMALTQPLLVNR